jgi:hypothetical protein
MRRLLPWVLWACAFFLTVFAIVLDPGGDWPVAFGFLLTGTIGALVASRRPQNPIGWIFCAMALGTAASFMSDSYASEARAHSLPAASYVSWFNTWLWIPTFLVAATFLLLLFPEGKLPSRRWRPVALVTGAALVLVALEEATTTEPLTGGYENPFGVTGRADDVLSMLRPVVLSLLLIAAAAAVLALISRFRGARGERRQQLKWFLFPAAFMPVGFSLAGIQDGIGGIHPLGDIGWMAALVAVVFGIPLGAGIAILRYRLYDIDVVINRTLVYGSLTALLAGTYLGFVLLFGLALEPLTGGSELAVAASTLAVAALFRPARRRIQAAVDRRFYRRKYDAARTLESFSARLRAEIDLDALRAELTGVVRETMQPAHVSLWLREAGR